MTHLETAQTHIEDLIRSIEVDIVLLDDNPHEMSRVKKRLEANGYNSVKCLTPNHTTVERLEMLDPKLIISDLFGCLGVDTMIKRFGGRVIINTGFHSHLVDDSVGKEVFGVAYKDEPDTLIDSIKRFFS